MRGATVDSGSPAASPSGYDAWLKAALQECERRVGPRPARLGTRHATETTAEPRIDRAACAAWLAAVPARDDREAKR